VKIAISEFRVLRTFMGIINRHLVDYPSTKSTTYFWGFGSLAGMFLIIQIITGLLLSMHYAANTAVAFSIVEHIMRDVNYGWLLRFMHANGASFFFIVLYIHVARGLYFMSFIRPRMALWFSGVLLFILVMATSFLGYVLPWGQMSFWGATVITNLFSAIPLVGSHLAYWLWGGFSVDNPTLNRFFSLHYLIPFIIAAVSLVHLILLHRVGSSDAFVECALHANEKLPFYPYLYVKDLVGFLITMLFFSIFVFFLPDALGHPDNYIEANPLVTPAHIVPEWYFLPFYAILRSIPDKLGGVICMFAALLVLFIIPFFCIRIPTVHASYNPGYEFFITFFFFVFVVLGWIGACSVEPILVLLGQLNTFFYFFILFSSIFFVPFHMFLFVEDIVKVK
jgi:ubiquinol-cytochrome c reductase cytochrome b/c1 subunit